jgi:cytochrome c5
MIRPVIWAGSMAVALALVGCGDDGDGATSAGTGGQGGQPAGQGGGGGAGGGGDVEPHAYYDGAESAKLGAATNGARCATCHSNDGTQAGFSGNTLKDIAYHETFKGGMADLRGAVNACVTGWMGGEALAETDERYVALKGYLESISSKDATTPNPLTPEVLADEAAYGAAYAGGDASAGAQKYASTCGKCHDAGLVVGSTPTPSKTALSAATIGRLAQKARTSGPPPSGANDATDSTPGPMPFFEPQDLSAQDLKDIIAHLKGA